MANSAPMCTLMGGERNMTSASGAVVRSNGSTPLVVVCGLMVAAPWFWPFLWGPVSAMWPDMFAWTMGALLLALLPWTRERAPMAIAGGWLLAALGSSVLGLLQYFDLENGLYPWVAPTSPGYVTANVHQLNMLASLLAVGLLCVWWLVQKRSLATVHAVWMSVLLLTAMAATASRTGMVHLMAISCMLFYWHPRQWRRVLLLVAVGWGFYSLAGSGLPWLAQVTRGIGIERDLLSRFGTDLGCHSRRVLWGNVIDLIALKPWSGWGSGELLYAHYITEFDGLRFCEKLSHAHNLPLQLAVTLGLPALAVAGVLFLYALFRFKPWAATDATERLCWGVLALLGVHSLLEYPLWFGVFQLMAVLAVWQIYRVRRQRAASEGQTAARPLPEPARVAASVLLLAAIAFVMWDYLKVTQLYLPPNQRLARYQVDTFNKVRDTVLFQSQVLMAQVVTVEPAPDNAEYLLAGALASLHVAPDARVIQRLLQAATMLGRDDLVRLHEARYKAAWPREYAEWKRRPIAPAAQAAPATK